jgi:hypothetical protein
MLCKQGDRRVSPIRFADFIASSSGILPGAHNLSSCLQKGEINNPKYK